jgi:ADP-glucose pyrophosphorylase
MSKLTTKKYQIVTNLPEMSSLALSKAKSNSNLNKILVLTKSDMARITDHLEKDKRDQWDQEEELRHKEEMYEKSKALTKNWTNTIEVNFNF